MSNPSTKSTTRQITELLSIIMQLGLHGGSPQAFMLVGPPGVGKTEVVSSLAQKLSEALNRPYPSEIWSGPQIQAEDAAGLPVPDLASGTTRLLPLRLGQTVLPAGAGLLCIDEFGSLSPSQEAAFLNLLQGGRLGENILPRTIALGAMMNPEDHASNGRALSAPAASRFIWLNWELDAGSWVDYMRGGQGASAHVRILPANWETTHGRLAAGYISSFIDRNRMMLNNMPKSEHASCAWPSPRGWTVASRLMAAVLATGERKESDLVHLALAGCVGEGAADAFMDWLIKLNLPDPEELLRNPKNAMKLLPQRPDQRAITLESVALAACDPTHKNADERWLAAWEILDVCFAEHDIILMPATHLSKNLKLGKGKFPPAAQKITGVLRDAGILK